jgi:hypothetical protein
MKSSMDTYDACEANAILMIFMLLYLLQVVLDLSGIEGLSGSFPFDSIEGLTELRESHVSFALT